MLKFFKQYKFLAFFFSAEISILFLILGLWIVEPRTSLENLTTDAQTSPAYLASILQAQGDLEYTLPDNTNTLPVVTQVSTNPLSDESLYIDPNSNAKSQADAWRTHKPDDAAKMDFLAQNSTAKWIVNNQILSVYEDVHAYINQATTGGKLPVLVAYNIPGRDCNSYSAGGATNAEDYKRWIENFSNGIDGNKTVVILEPDALASIDCLDERSQELRYSLLHYATEVLKENARTLVYLDAGNSRWVEASVIAKRLERAGAYLADGFALNVSNFNTTYESTVYGENVSKFLGGKHFVIDTSRNGSGSAPHFEWCNPHGRSVGPSPTVNTNNDLVDAYLWIKVPGESDGNCNGGPNAGEWWADYALSLVSNMGVQPAEPIDTPATESTGTPTFTSLKLSTAASLKAGASHNNKQTPSIEIKDREPISYVSYPSDYGKIDIWWPADSNGVNGLQPFKALVTNRDVNSYKMYWSVDNGKLNLMSSNYADYPHKEAQVDLTGWNWKSNNTYEINFVAKDLMGNTFASKTISLNKI